MPAAAAAAAAAGTCFGCAIDSSADHSHCKCGAVAVLALHLILGLFAAKVRALAKIRQLRHVCLINQDVVGLDVAVDQWLRELVMQVAEPGGNSERQAVSQTLPSVHGAILSRTQI